jgi:phage I-like protein
MLPAGDAVPERVQLVPAGTFRGIDGRGPYTLDDPDAVIRASMQGGARLVFDQDHATDHSLKTGIPAPARGWITSLEAREGAIWGRIDWTDEGKRLLTSKEYRGVSPVLMHDRATGRITRVLRATLTNAPNLDLPALHARQAEGNEMELLAELRALFGAPDADAATIVVKARDAVTAVAAHAQQLVSIAKAAKLDEKAGPDAIVTALQTRGAGGGTLEEVTALQTRIVELENGVKRQAAEKAIDAAVRAGKPILATRREEFITRHMQDPEGTERWLADMPSLQAGGLGARGPAPKAEGGLDATEAQVIALMGLDPTKFAERKAAMGEGVTA